jgi:hypothetical protein
MTTRYELRPTANANGNYLDVFIAGAPTSAGCEARVPLRVGREHHCREFAEHIVNLLNADVLEQARRANLADALNRYADKSGLSAVGRNKPVGVSGDDGISAGNGHGLIPAYDTDERWQQC